jgi:uncharacterized protein (TIGR03083 family)
VQPSTWAFDHATYCDLVEAEGERAASAATRPDPSARVPSCPDWSVEELVEHLGDVHRWAGEHVRRMSQVRLSSKDLDLDHPDGSADYARWIRAGVQELVATLRTADPDAEVWGWGADKYVRFWARRMLHETTIHRADLDIAFGIEPEIEAAIAADGIDELFENLPHARRFRPEVMALRGKGETIAFRATDAEDRWTIHLGPEGFRCERDSDQEAIVTVSGPVAPLLLHIYGRETEASRAVTVEGDRALLEFWRTNSAL